MWGITVKKKVNSDANTIWWVVIVGAGSRKVNKLAS